MMTYNYIQCYEAASYKITSVLYNPSTTDEVMYYLVHPAMRMPDICVKISRVTMTTPYYRKEIYVNPTVIGNGHSAIGVYTGHHLVKEAREYIEKRFTALAEELYECMSAISATLGIKTPQGAKTPGLII